MIKNQTISMNQMVSQGEGNIVSDMDGEKVMLSINNGKYYNLGEVGGEIWELLKEPVSIQTVVTTLQVQYDVNQTDCVEQVTTFLNRLKEEDLITLSNRDNS